MMWRFIIYAGMWVVIVLPWLVGAISKRVVHEIFAALGFGIAFALLILMWLGYLPPRQTSFFVALDLIGRFVAILIPVLFIASVVALKRKGKPEHGWEHTTTLVDTGIYGIIRHPVYLAGAVWSVVLIMWTQSLLPLVFGIAAAVFWWMASKEEDRFNLEKFGDEYRYYMARVPMWNIFKGLFNLRKR